MMGKYLQQLVLALALMTCVGAAEPEIPGEVIFESNFNTRADFERWGRPAGMEWSANGGIRNSGCVRFSYAAPVNSVASIELPLAQATGGVIVLEGWVKAENVAVPEKSYLGVKAMLAKTFPGEDGAHEIKDKAYGSYEWRKFLISCDVPPAITKLSLILGLQGTTGTVYFDELKVYRLKRRENVVLRPEFKSRELQKTPRYRGVMSGGDFSEEAFQTLRAWNVNLMRFQITSNGIENVTEAGFRAGVTKSLERFDAILPLARKYGVKMVLDLHYGPGTGINNVFSNSLSWEPAQQQLLIQIWREIAARYRKEPMIYGYDILNEPREDNYEYRPDNDDWQGLAEKVCAAIREVDPDTPIIVEPIQWGSAGGMAHLQPIQQPGIIYSFHFYDPGAYTHQGVHGVHATTGISYPSEIDGKFYDRNALLEIMKPAIDFQKKHQVPIYVGEFGAVRWAPGADRYLADVVSIFEEHGWDWTYHAFREWRGWSLESFDERENENFNPAMNPRKQVLLDFFKRNQSEPKQ